MNYISKIKKANTEQIMPYMHYAVISYFFSTIFVTGIISLKFGWINGALGTMIAWVLIPSYLLFSQSSFFIRYKVLLREFVISRFPKRRFKPEKNNYEKIVSRNGITIYKKKYYGKMILCAYKNVLVICNSKKNIMYIVPDYHFRLIKYKVKLNKKNFPELIKKSKIENCMIIPYPRYYDAKRGKLSFRICVVTDRAQIYHNYPDREYEYAGRSHWEDVIAFQESVIWDRPNRKYPSVNPVDREVERVFLGLPNEAYEYHPSICLENSINEYGSRRFGRSSWVINEKGEKIKVGRFYVPQRRAETNPFAVMGGYECNHKMALIGTYRSNTKYGARTCLFMSSDGGRQWYCKYEFGDAGEYVFRQGNVEEWGRNWGNRIMGDWVVPNSKLPQLYVRKRKVIYPSKENKEPLQFFSWSEPLYVERIVADKEKIMFIFYEEHMLETGNVISVGSTDIDKDNVWAWMINNKVSDKNAGNGMLFKVEVININTIALNEFVMNEDNNIVCRHIHHINHVKDGWLLGTGEIYPNSWVMYIQLKDVEKATRISANEYICIERLNSTEESIQRTMGVLWDEDSNSLFFASDHDTICRQTILGPSGRNLQITRSSVGIFAGKLCDIDDFRKFRCIKETSEVAYFFKEIEGNIIWCGQQGEMYIYKNNQWVEFSLPRAFEQYMGKTYDFLVLNDYLVEIH